MKKYKFEGEEVSIVKDLGIKDKLGTWVQIEFLSGKNKGFRKSEILENLKPV